MRDACVFIVVLALCLAVGGGLVALNPAAKVDSLLRIWACISGAAWLVGSILFAVSCAYRPWKYNIETEPLRAKLKAAEEHLSHIHDSIDLMDEDLQTKGAEQRRALDEIMEHVKGAEEHISLIHESYVWNANG